MNIFLNSLPKSGTNMVQKCLELASIPYSGKSVAASSNFGKRALVKKVMRQPCVSETPVLIGLEVPVVVSPKWLKGYLRDANGYVSGHSTYSESYHAILKSEDYKVIQVVRHPCAVLASWANYIAEPEYYWSQAQCILAKMNFEDRVSFLLYGGELGSGSNTYYKGFRDVVQQVGGWVASDDVLTICFEDLVGEKGGGNDLIQRQVVESIFHFLNYPLSEKEFENVVANLYGGTHTFRSGAIEGWKSKMTESLIAKVYNELDHVSWISKQGFKW